ncbi:MAG: sensor histidine kinase, partial [Anaerorhabdus sp.]
IVLLVIADLLTYLNSNRYRFAFLGCMIVFYIVANYDFLSAKVAMVSFYDYISCYDSVTKSILLSIQNVLSSLNIIAFIIYMILLVQDKINENKKFVEMNDELKNLNSQLKEYANIREKMGETRERNRLAREIHDTLGHTLTGLSVGLDASVLTCVIDPDTTKKQLMVLRDSAKRGLNDVRRSVDKLRPDALEHYSLKEAIDQMIVEFSELTDIEIHFVCHLPNLKFDADEEEIIYRIIQESMTNSVRHGHAHKIYISIAKEKNMLILIIEDDGIGCQHIKPDFGLHHMKERIELLQGNIRFYGYDGFIIIAEIPIREESKL